MKKSIIGLLGAAAVGSMLMFTSAPASYAAELVVKVAPPALRVEVVPRSPGAGYAWRPGYWRWNGYHHVWTGGVYLRRPHPGAEWTAGRWEDRPGGHVWIGGHW
jgi:WXXGXW repeat (2 copies)